MNKTRWVTCPCIHFQSHFTNIQKCLLYFVASISVSVQHLHCGAWKILSVWFMWICNKEICKKIPPHIWSPDLRTKSIHICCYRLFWALVLLKSPLCFSLSPACLHQPCISRFCSASLWTISSHFVLDFPTDLSSCKHNHCILQKCYSEESLILSHQWKHKE